MVGSGYHAYSAHVDTIQLCNVGKILLFGDGGGDSDTWKKPLQELKLHLAVLIGAISLVLHILSSFDC